MEQKQPHVLLVLFPAQGHINPALQFAKNLVRRGVSVTFSTTTASSRRMSKPTIDGLSFATFSDGHDDGFKLDDDLDNFMYEVERWGPQSLTDYLATTTKEGPAFTLVIYSILVPWVAEVARSFHLPSVLLWNQPASIFDIYYFYYNGYEDVIMSNNTNPSPSIKLPSLPLLSCRDIPSFFLPSNTFFSTLRLFKWHMDILAQEKNPKILVNTFDELEHEALRAIDKFNMIPIGPLLPSAYLDGKDPSDTTFGGDLVSGGNSYVEWLNSKPHESVVYVSFGSMSQLTTRQTEEIARGLLDSGRPFLWVLRVKGEERELKYREEMEKKGKIVEWCSQVEVLSNPSVGCFVSHCGWNSSVEGLVSGVPMVGFPQWTDQRTNAKLIEDVWKNGVRVKTNEEGILEGEEMKRCLDIVMGEGEKGVELRRNAKKWKESAKEATKEGGTSDLNLKAFVDEIRRGCF